MTFKDITIMTGGQTGVDRAAMDFALACNISCNGYCPKGRIAEDGAIPDIYLLKETITDDYSERTRKNIEQSDGVLILYDQLLDKGTKLTIELCKVLNCPFLIIKVNSHLQKQNILDWINTNKIKRLNIAGPRESSDPGIYNEALKYLHYIFG